MGSDQGSVKSRSPPKGKLAAVLNSPRTLEAMATLGLKAEELEPISYESVRHYFIQRERKQAIPKQLVDLRFETLNKRRHQKRQMIIEEREKIIRQEQDLRGGKNAMTNNFMTINSSVTNPMFNHNSIQNYSRPMNQSFYSPQTAGSGIRSNSKFGSIVDTPMTGGIRMPRKFVQSNMQGIMRSTMYTVSPFTQ